MKNIVRRKKLIGCIALAVLLLGIGSLLCFGKISFSANYYDALATAYGSSGYRVHNTQELINAFNDVMVHYKSGVFHFVSDPSSEKIDANKFKEWYKSRFVLDDWQRNYYTYTEKGDYEPDRFNDIDLYHEFTGDFEYDFNRTRVTEADKRRADHVIGRLANDIRRRTDGSEFQLIYDSYRYIKDTTTYITDNGFNYIVEGNTGAKHTFVDRKSVCIGFSIAFSLLMDQYGIESYIVDQVTENNRSARRFSSVHSYNVVKYNGKFYVVDVTVGQVFKRVNASELKSWSKGTLSTTDLVYTQDQRNHMNQGFNWSFANSYVNEARNMSIASTTISPGTSKAFVVEYDDDGNRIAIEDTTTTKLTYTTSGAGSYHPGDNGSTTTNMADYLASRTSVIRDANGQTRIVTVKENRKTTVKTTKRKYIKVFTTVKADNGTTKVVRMKETDDGKFEEISLEEMNNIEKSNKIVLRISKRNKIILGAIVIVSALIGVQVYRHRHYKTGRFTTIEFTLGNRTEKNDDYSNFAATNYDENRK